MVICNDLRFLLDRGYYGCKPEGQHDVRRLFQAVTLLLRGNSAAPYLLGYDPGDRTGSTDNDLGHENVHPLDIARILAKCVAR